MARNSNVYIKAHSSLEVNRILSNILLSLTPKKLDSQPNNFKMQFTILSIVALLAATVVATPTPVDAAGKELASPAPAAIEWKESDVQTATPLQLEQSNNIGTKATINVIMCLDANFRGTCVNFLTTTGVCCTPSRSLFLSQHADIS